MSRYLTGQGTSGITRATVLPERGRASRSTMAALVRDLVDSLSPEQRGVALWPFDTQERFNWHYVPREREGLPIRRMGAPTREALDALLRYALSETGYEKASGIRRIEEVLGLMEGRPQFRDPENYSLTVFGEPGRGPFAWRLEGHHLSLNFTGIDEEVIAVLPTFWGSNPARVPDGYPMAGHRVLGRETDLAYELIRGLGEAERARAIICETSLGNIVTGPGREHLLTEQEGLPLPAMADDMRNLALTLLDLYARNLRGELAERELARMREAGLDRVHFAWGGPLESGHAHYWRLHGPLTLIEFDNTQDDANHIHTVWHDLERDFGRDLLKEHYTHGHAHGH